MSNPSIALEKQLEYHRQYINNPKRTVDNQEFRQGYTRTDYDPVNKRLTMDDRKFELLLDTTLMSALEVGETFYWSPEICDLMAEVSQTMPEYTLRPEAVPSTDGFFYFDKPITLANGHILQAIAWHIYHVEVDPGVVAQEMELTEGDKEFIDTFNTEHKHGSLIFVTIEKLEKQKHNIIGHPSFISSGIIWTVGKDSSAPKKELFTGDSESQVINEIDLIASCFSFIEQRILVTPKEGIDRAARRRLQKSYPAIEPLVRTVQLRRRSYTTIKDTNGTPEQTEWSCRWIVRGFWRQQWFPKQRVHKPIWISPYVKGPEDKPLKPNRATVNAVVR